MLLNFPQKRQLLELNLININSQVHSLDSDVNTSPTQSLNMLSASSFDCSQMGRSSPVPDLQTYVTEMTKELATNIKSEIREVINKVEDVLENTDNTNEKHCNSSDDGRSDSISANEVAEYIEKVSIEMANEVKSEIRDVVSAVDVFIAPEVETYTPGSSSETVIQLIKEEKAPNRNRIAPSTVTSLSSQDSGINLSFQEQECTFHDYVKRRCSSECIANQNHDVDVVKFATLQRQKRKELPEDDKEPFGEVNPWVCPQKALWQVTVEAVEEFGMIRNGDKVLVCLSGGKDSISLLHTLLEYQHRGQSNGVVFSLAAVTVNTEACSCTPALLATHLSRLGVHYIVESCTRENDCDTGEY